MTPQTLLFEAIEQLLVIMIIFLANILLNVPFRMESQCASFRPWFGKNIRIFNCSLIAYFVISDAAIALDHVVGCGVTVFANCALIIKSGYVDNERIAFPLANRISHPGGIEIRGMRPSVGGNHAEEVLGFVKYQHDSRLLHDLQ